MQAGMTATTTSLLALEARRRPIPDGGGGSRRLFLRTLWADKVEDDHPVSTIIKQARCLLHNQPDSSLGAGLHEAGRMPTPQTVGQLLWGGLPACRVHGAPFVDRFELATRGAPWRRSSKGAD